MNYSIVAVLLLLFATPYVSAIDIHQGDIVYMGETVDLSLALAWPDYSIAWCDSTNYECDPPDQVIEIAGYMHNYYIDPAKFHYGTYYRWSGEWSSSENAVAFTVAHGSRNDTPLQVAENSDIAAAPARIIQEEGPYSWIIARWDDPAGYTNLKRSDTCYLWLFSNNIDILGIRMEQSEPINNLTTYSYHFSEDETKNLTVGKRSGYIQCVGRNNMQDIFVDGKTLDTIYDDSKIPDVPVDSWNPYNVKASFDSVYAKMLSYSTDDVLIPITVDVRDAKIHITDIYTDERNEKMYISGITSWKNQTVLTFMIDPDQYALKSDIRMHSWTATASGPIDSIRRFSTTFNLKKNELSIGNHEITSTVEGKNMDVGYGYYSFKVSDVYVMPTPTPYIERRIYESDWSDVKVNKTNTYVPTPTFTSSPTPVETDVIPLQNVTNETYMENASYVIVTNESGYEINEAITNDSKSLQNITNGSKPLPIIPHATNTIQTIPINYLTAIAAVCLIFLSRRKLA